VRADAAKPVNAAEAKPAPPVKILEEFEE
jgi:hypothetical protein